MVKDGTKMGLGSPEFLLVFRKPQTNKGKAYADEPVTKSKQEYGLGKWQIDADLLWRSSGNRMLPVDELVRLANSKNGLKAVREKYKEWFNKNGYDYEQHVEIAETLNDAGRLPKLFSLMTPPLTDGQKEWVWDDILRMRTLNMSQALKKKEQHICPLQLDVVNRCIDRWSNKGDVVFDPFGGINTVGFCAVKKGRYGLATELNNQYWKDGCSYARDAEDSINVPTLFDVLED
jgi:DNA modification methylase